MAAQIRVLRRRIKSTQSIKKITRAMELIATSRIVKARARVEAAKPYAEQMTAVLTELASNSALDHPLLVERENPERAAVLVVTSDRGQAGGYNSNVLREAEQLQTMLREQGKEPVLYVIGRKGVNYYRFRKREVAASWTGFSEQPTLRRRGRGGPGAGGRVHGRSRRARPRGGRRHRGCAGRGRRVGRRAAPGLHPVQEHGHADPAGPADGADGGGVRRRRVDSVLSGSGSGDGQPEIRPLYTFEPDAETLFDALLPQATSAPGSTPRCWSPRRRSRRTGSEQ